MLGLLGLIGSCRGDGGAVQCTDDTFNKFPHGQQLLVLPQLANHLRSDMVTTATRESSHSYILGMHNMDYGMLLQSTYIVYI